MTILNIKFVHPEDIKGTDSKYKSNKEKRFYLFDNYSSKINKSTIYTCTVCSKLFYNI
jgi:hypothetical protein